MPWNLKIHTPTKTALLHEYSNTTPGGLNGGFKWQLRPTGDTVRLEFAGRNDLLGIPPRAVVALTVDGQPAFYGVAPDVPSSTSPDADTVIVEGGREALRLALMDGKVYRNAGVFTIVRDVLSRLAPPAVTYAAALIGDGTGTDAGPTLGTYYAPTATLVEVLDGLAKSAGVNWGVDAQGRVFFGQPDPAALNVAYASGQPWNRLPVQGREVVTQAVVRVISGPNVGDGKISRDVRILKDPGAVPADYRPATLTKTATHAEHPTYRAAQAFEAPEGVALVVRSLGTVQASTATTNEANAWDGDASTAGVMIPGPGVPAQMLLSDAAGAQRVVGVRLEYLSTIPEGQSQYLVLEFDQPNKGNAAQTQVRWELTSGGRQAIMGVLPPDVGALDDGAYQARAQLVVNAASSGPTVEVYEFSLLVIDEAAALRVAESYLQAPYATPVEVTVPSLVSPAPEVTVTGSPDGTVTGPAALFEYEHTTELTRSTRVRLGSTGQDPAVRALRWAVRS